MVSSRTQSHWKPFEDVIPYLERSEGERLGVITNGDLSEQRLKLERMGVLNYFEVIVASGDIGFSKTDKRIFQAACEWTGTSVSEMIYVGDDPATDIISCEVDQQTE
ncbi:HAD family hydrolase [Paenibacillus sp. NPDC056579]|uniref:HAD family hydrolase n=1 Tax=Paenibacillus sp. NPDC056579 TaxID=3345871 RepID=UPI0036942544